MNDHDLKQRINRLLHLTEEYYTRGDISFFDLLKETGYFVWYNEITVENILNELSEDSECIKEWLQWSEDTRSDSAWLFYKKENGTKYIVCFVSEARTKKSNITEYSNINEAGANYIKRAIEHTRTVDSRKLI